MGENNSKTLNVMRGPVLPVALAAVTGLGAATFYMLNRQKTSQEVVEESQPDAKDGTTFDTKEIVQNPEDSKNDCGLKMEKSEIVMF